jgi:glycosyltransferase involved in cell wall biosynthesis
VRVLIVCDWFLKHAVGQAAALARAGADVSLLCRSHNLEFGGSTAERQQLLGELNGIPVRVLDGRVRSVSRSGQILQLRRSTRQWRPDVVHAQDNADPRLLGIVGGLPRAVTIHDPVPHPGQPALGRVETLVRRRWISGSSLVLVHGQSLVAELPPWISRTDVAVVPLGVTVTEQPLPVPPRPTVLLFGRLERYKGVSVLLDAMNQVWESRPEVLLRIAGEGAEAARVPADERIDFRRGYVPEADVESLLAETTVAVLPYIQASQSGVGSLALSYGVPAIVSNVGSLREIAVDETYLVAPRDPQALARAILAHVDDDQSSRQKALEFARSRLSWDSCAPRLLDLYANRVVGRAA